MNCPVCREPMLVLEVEEVEIDHCPECRGIWLDRGEWALLDVAAAGPLAVDEPGRPGRRRCPICRKKMEKVGLQGVGLDRCRDGDGWWFDGGELEQVLALAGRENDRVVGWLREIFGGQQINGKED